MLTEKESLCIHRDVVVFLQTPHELVFCGGSQSIPGEPQVLTINLSSRRKVKVLTHFWPAVFVWNIVHRNWNH